MKVRLVVLVIGVLSLLGIGTGPAAAAPTSDVCPILYPFCG